MTVLLLWSGRTLLGEFSVEYEELYYQRMSSRLHFIRPCIHALIHYPWETMRLGPYPVYSQRAMENAIGNLGAEIKQPSKPYANLAQRALRRCQVNAIKAAFPEFAPEKPLPEGAVDLGSGYILLWAADAKSRRVPQRQAEALLTYVEGLPAASTTHISAEWRREPEVARWARLQLPTGQIARSLWKEQLGLPRTSRNVKVSPIHHSGLHILTCPRSFCVMERLSTPKSGIIFVCLRST